MLDGHRHHQKKHYSDSEVEKVYEMNEWEDFYPSKLKGHHKRRKPVSEERHRGPVADEISESDRDEEEEAVKPAHQPVPVKPVQ